MSTGPSGFKKLVRMVARSLYAGACPPKDDPGPKRRKWDKVQFCALPEILVPAFLPGDSWILASEFHASSDFVLWGRWVK